MGGDKSRADSAACVSCRGDCEVARGETAYKDEAECFGGKDRCITGRGKRMLEHISKLVHLGVFLLFVPGIFGSLGMDEISMPILNLLDTMWGYLPNILAAVVVLWVGLFISRLVREILTPAKLQKFRNVVKMVIKCIPVQLT